MSERKKIVIFTCRGGGCHISVHRALQAYLSDEYEVIITDFIRDVVGGLDPIQFLTRHKYGADDFYNFCIAHNSTKKMMSFLTKIALKLVFLFQDFAFKRLVKFLKKEQPVLVISIIPIFNGIISQAADVVDIPFLLFPLDLNAQEVFLNGLTAETVSDGYCAIPFSDHLLGHKERSALPFESERVSVLGYPLRPEFFEKKDLKKIKGEFSLPGDKPIIMLLMGGAGSENTFLFYKKLLELNIPSHIIICLGRNERLRERLEKLPRPSHISASIIGYIPNISNLMAVSDLLITKPGPGSICEGLYLNIPMIIDETSGVLFWEQFHVEFVEKNRLGDVLRDLEQLPELVTRYLSDSAYYEKIKKNQKEFDKKEFNKEVKELIASIVS